MTETEGKVYVTILLSIYWEELSKRLTDQNLPDETHKQALKGAELAMWFRFFSMFPQLQFFRPWLCRVFREALHEPPDMLTEKI